MSTVKTIVSLVALLALAGCDTFTSTDTRLARAENLMVQLNYSGALIEIKNVLQKEPDNARAHFDMAQIVLRLGDASHAEQELKRALELSGGKPFTPVEGLPTAAELDARIRLAQRKADEVLADIDSGKLALSEATRPLYRGQALMMLGRIPEAQTELLAAVKADPDSVQAAVGLTNTYAYQGKAKESLEAIDALLARRPDAAEALVAKGVLLAALRRNKEAEEALTKANQHAGQLAPEQRARLLATLTNARLKDGDVEGAQKFQDTLAALSADAPITRMLAAQIATARKDFDGAASELQRLVQDAPEFVPARILLGDVLIKLERYEQAEQQLKFAIQRAPNNPLVQQLMALVSQKLGRPIEAPAVAAAPGRISADDPRLKKALEYMRAGHKKSAIAEYEKLAAAHPRVPGVLNNLAWLYFETGDKRALDTARLAHELAPQAPEISDTYGWILFKAGRQEEALKLLKVAAAASKNPEIHKHYAEVQAAAGK